MSAQPVTPTPPPTASTATAAASPANPRARRWLTWILLVLTCISIVAATASVWTHRTLLDGDTWVKNITAPIIRDPAVVDELSVNLTDRVFERLQVQQRLEGLLPDALKPIAGPLVASLQNRVEERVHQALSSPQAQAAWDQASLIAHDQIVAIIRGDSTVITSQDGTIYLDLRGLLQTVLQALQSAGVIPATVDIPDFSSFETPERVQEWLQTNLGLAPGTDLTLVPLGSAAGLQKAQTALQVFDVLVIVLIITSIALAVMTVLVALDRRRAIVELAIGIAVSFVLAYVAIGAVQGWLVGQLTGGALGAAGSATVTSALDDLASWVSLLVGVSVVVAVVAYLLSGPRWLRALPRTRAGAWAANNMGAMRAAGIIIPLGLLLIVPRGPVIILAIVALAATYQIVLTGLARDVAAQSPATPTPAPGT